MKTHLFIPDLQIRPGIPLDYCKWIGKYIKDKDPDKVIFAGDVGDMPSLSSYDKGKLSFEGRRYKKDIDSVHRGLDLLFEECPNCTGDHTLTYGNHEERINWATQKSPELEGLIQTSDLGYESIYDIKTYPYLVPVNIDGIYYCHYFTNPDSLMGNALSGTIENRLNKLGCSFTQGHQQKLQYGMRYATGRVLHGLVAGACYPHKEVYMGPQGNEHWRGVIMKHEVRSGQYDPMFVSLGYLKRRFK